MLFLICILFETFFDFFGMRRMDEGPAKTMCLWSVVFVAEILTLDSVTTARVPHNSNNLPTPNLVILLAFSPPNLVIFFWNLMATVTSHLDNFTVVSKEEVALHNKVQDAWLILNGEVLDVTRWIPLHPGGEQTIKRFLGKDASLEWNMIHAPGTAASCKSELGWEWW